MSRPPDMRSPGRARTGAQDCEAGAVVNPFDLDTLSSRQAQFLIAAHRVTPGLAKTIAGLAFGSGCHG